jgi:hypothetical protein
MTANLTASAAILKVKYPTGALPKAQYQKFPWVASVSKKEDFDGESRTIAIQTENPQGSSSDFPTALGSLQQGTYKKFTLTRVQHFGVARITGQAMKAAAKDSGSLVNLWKNETDGASATEMKGQEIYCLGDGDGVLGVIASGSTGATVTLATPTDIVKFDLGIRLQAVSAVGLSPTLRAGFVTVTGIDRSAGTLTVSGNWNAVGNIPGIGSTDALVRMGDNAASGVGKVVTGVGQWLVGGTSPGTLFGCVRTDDPVRLASQVYDATNVNYTDAIIEAESLRNMQYVSGQLEMWANPRDIAQWKKQLMGKVTYERCDVKGTMAGVSFKGIAFDGDNGPINVMTSPFIGRNKAYLLAKDSFCLQSIGPAPQMLDFDNNNFLRVASDDAYEVRFGAYLQQSCDVPSASIRISNFGL